MLILLKFKSTFSGTNPDLASKKYFTNTPSKYISPYVLTFFLFRFVGHISLLRVGTV